MADKEFYAMSDAQTYFFAFVIFTHGWATGDDGVPSLVCCIGAFV